MALMLAGCGGSSSSAPPATLTSIAISPNPIFIGAGTTLHLAATGSYSNGTTTDLTSQVVWKSVDPLTASVAASGVVTAVAGAGATTTISASLNSVTSPTVSLTVTLTTSVFSNGLNFARYDHTATLLNDGTGRVLVAGGYDNVALGTAELYDPVTTSWTITGGLGVARRDHTATALAAGNVLVIGGGNASGDLNSAELYSPGTGTWTLYPGVLQTTRSYHTATLLNTGNVLVVGGAQVGGLLDYSVDLYNPSSGITTPAALDTSPRYSHTATLLATGNVLVAGGFNYLTGSALGTAELYTSTGSRTSTNPLATARYLHSATLLQDGRVLVVGGIDATGKFLASAELYYPVAVGPVLAGTWTTTGSLAIPRFGHIATLMPDGKVLVMGGRNASNPTLSSAELYDPTTGTWSGTANLQTGRAVFSATLLGTAPTSKVLVVGGEGTVNGSYVILSSVELHN